MALAVLGILIIIAVLAIKFSSGSPTDEFMGITNPEGTYGMYFLSGIVVGIIVMIIGGAMSMRKEEEPMEKEEEMFTEEEETFTEEEESETTEGDIFVEEEEIE